MLIGIFYAVMGAFLYGIIPVLSKSLLIQCGPATAGALTFLGAGAVAAIASRMRRIPDQRGVEYKIDLPYFLPALTLGAILAPLLLMVGMQRTTASFASVLSNIEGLGTVLLAWTLFREKATVLAVVSSLAILAGVTAFSLMEEVAVSNGAGPLLVAAAYLCWAIDLNLMERVKRIEPVRSTAIRGFAGGAVMIIIACLLAEPMPGARWVLVGILAGAVGFGMSFILLLKALRIIGTARTGALFASAPVSGYFGSALVEERSMNLLGLAGLTLVGVGICLAIFEAFWSRRRRETS